MQFIANGPNIPEALLQAHEEGRVVFFCGAGISYPAGLPSFAELVKKVYDKLAVTPNDVQNAAINAGQFDTAIGLLEADIVGEREIVRRALAEILTPDIKAQSATATHEALLMLAKCRNGQTRLITTNFDRLFEKVIIEKMNIDRFKAPLLPVPKKRWDGLVYLHGLLSEEPTKSELDQLIVTSGDFGLAYLTEGWAARFVSELPRCYTVCFVGYSINDPVMRYIVDALAADRLLGESSPEMFAFGSYSEDKEKDQANEWRAKNVTPILYHEEKQHAALHRTLRAWAETYSAGVNGKERIVVECAIAQQLSSKNQEYFIPRMLWALSDPSGLPAKCFAELNPVPSLDWLVPLSEKRYGHADLNRFGVSPKIHADKDLSFSLTCRPSPYQLAPLMCVVDAGTHGDRWDEVIWQLARWMVRHLDDPALLLWLVKQGGRLHEKLGWLIDRRLKKLFEYEREGNTAELDRILANAPKAIPGPLMRTLWRLLLTKRVKSWTRTSIFCLDNWINRFKRDGFTATLRLELRDILTPYIALSEPNDDQENSAPMQIKQLVDWKLVLSTDHIRVSMRDLFKDDSWIAILPQLLSDFSALLRDALDLMCELGGAEDKSDLSYISHPSIIEHEQNRSFDDWTVLIDLTRDAWLATAIKSPERAALVAQSWWDVPYPLFRRLAFFAAAQDNVIPLRSALNWLLADNHRWLWSVETQRETMRLLKALAAQFDEAMLAELEQAILAGPSSTVFNSDIKPDILARTIDYKIWFRLAKIAEAGAILGTDAQNRLNGFSAQYPEWQIKADYSDEFPIYWGSFDVQRTLITTPHCRRELIEWLRHPPSMYPWQKDDWQQRCRDNFSTTACALCALAKEDVWPTDRWSKSLYVWSEENLAKRSWHYMVPVMTTMPENVLQPLSHAVSFWLRAIAKVSNEHEEHFFELVQRILAQNPQDNNSSDTSIGRAINHPVGHVTEALLHWWYRDPLEDGQGLPEKLKSVFTELCNAQLIRFRHGRVLLAAHVITLYRVDQDWAIQHLLPLFDWRRSEDEAKAVWNGFLSSPRLYHPLMQVLKQSFLDTACHYSTLGQFNEQYASLLAFVALNPGDTFTTTELAKATDLLPSDGLRHSVKTLVRALQGASNQRVDYWTNRVEPYFQKIWPKTKDRISPDITESLAELCVVAHDAFPQALALLQHWLQPTNDYPRYIVSQLHESGLCKTSPDDALGLLNALIADQKWPSGKLRECLDEIKTSAPNFVQNPHYVRLHEYLRRNEIL